jgi:hypothetical protein
MGHDRPENALVNIIFHIWHEFFQRLWDTRNNILHRSHNMTTTALETSLMTRCDGTLPIIRGFYHIMTDN